MSRKSEKILDTQLDSLTSYNNYPQPYDMQQPMMNPYSMQGGNMGMFPYNNNNMNNNSMFFYEPVPIKKRNREPLVILMVLTKLIPIAISAVVYFLLFAILKGFLAPLVGEIIEEVIGLGGSVAERLGTGVFETIVWSVAIGGAIFVLLQLASIIYRIIAMCHISQEINLIASDYDRKTTPFYALTVFLTPLTLGIYTIIYYNALCARIGSEIKRRSIRYKFDEGTFWGWGVLGILLLGIGPIIFFAKMFKAMKILTKDYNMFG